MRRIAAHYIFWKDFLPLHYIELDDNNLLVGVFPLKEEIAGTEFWDGTICPVCEDSLTDQRFNSLESVIESGMTQSVKIGDRIQLLHFS